ncbi:cell division protein ZapE [Cohnella pontilimi]|uniref:Cell division protein ZapE n=1 Tax=Cohnella pontilimi TaxID=2564100 RepID=A0A4U0F5S6_9BACL|nr:ATP-binding protein [Cohnella pontilimi]TJY39780.1 cell division protein ZapE [Cohnella pontilimi]
MESLKEALKGVSVTRFAGDSERLMSEVLRDPLVQKLRERYPDMGESVLRANLNRLYQMSKEYRNCKACPGLEQCPNDMQGHSTVITCSEVNGRWQITDHKSPCAKWTAYEHQQQIRRRITGFFVDETIFGETYDEMEMDNLDEDRSLAVHELLAYVAVTKEQGLQKHGLYLVGSFGTGKTYMAGYLLQKLAKKGFTGVMVYMPDFVEDVKALMLEPQKLKETITLMKEADLLVFDDIGAENLSPWVRDHVVGAILNYRMNRKPTFYTSNHDLDALEKHFSFTHKEGEEMHKGQRLMDRVRPFVQVVHVRGRNQRG